MRREVDFCLVGAAAALQARFGALCPWERDPHWYLQVSGSGPLTVSPESEVKTQETY